MKQFLKHIFGMITILVVIPWFFKPLLVNILVDKGINNDDIIHVVVLILSICFYMQYYSDTWKISSKIYVFESLKYIYQNLVKIITQIFGLFFISTLSVGLLNKLGQTTNVDNYIQATFTNRETLFIILLVAILGPIYEEIVFRGLLQGKIFGHFKPFWAIMISSVIFALSHGTYVHLLFGTVAGIFFGMHYYHSKKLLVPILIHLCYNIIVIMTGYLGN